MLCWSVRVLLLDLLLLAVTSLDTEQQQREKDHDLSAGAGRGPPQNVNVEPVSSRALYVSWNPPDEAPSKYSVETEGDPHDTTNTFYLIDGLDACTAYVITVTSVYDNENYPAIVMGTTNSTAPPPPQNCVLSKITETSMKVTWTDPDSKCRITDYFIIWSWDVLWSEDQGSNETFSNSNSITLTKFKPYTNVTVNIAAGTSAGYGAPTTCWGVTLQDVPGEPVITRIQYTEHLLYITWSPPEEANGVILRDLVDIVDNGQHTREYVNGTETEAVISDLPECVSYDITVTAETEPGWGRQSTANNTFLSGSVAPSLVTCDLGDGGDARVCWKPCSQHCLTGDLRYSISWRSDVLWSSSEDSGDDSSPWENKDNTCYTMGSSVPYANYSFCVGVVDQETDTQCCSVVTPQAVPGVVVITNLTTSEESVYVTWSPPEEENGIILYYSINIMNENEAEIVTVEGSANEAVITDLQQCVWYNISVEAATEAGWGPPSHVDNIFITGLPSPPNKCWFSGITYNKMVLNWVAPDSQCGLVNIYRINWSWDVLWSDEQGSNETLSKETSITLSDLPSYTKVTADVAAASDTGFGPTTTCWNVTSPDTT